MKPVRVVVECLPGRDHPFPVDMLRYDSLVPATEMDSALIGGSLMANRRPRQAVTLTGPHGATVGRWESFGFHVVEGARK